MLENKLLESLLSENSIYAKLDLEEDSNGKKTAYFVFDGISFESRTNAFFFINVYVIDEAIPNTISYHNLYSNKIKEFTSFLQEGIDFYTNIKKTIEDEKFVITEDKCTFEYFNCELYLHLDSIKPVTYGPIQYENIRKFLNEFSKCYGKTLYKNNGFEVKPVASDSPNTFSFKITVPSTNPNKPDDITKGLNEDLEHYLQRYREAESGEEFTIRNKHNPEIIQKFTDNKNYYANKIAMLVNNLHGFEQLPENRERMYNWTKKNK